MSLGLSVSQPITNRLHYSHIQQNNKTKNRLGSPSRTQCLSIPYPSRKRECAHQLGSSLYLGPREQHANRQRSFSSCQQCALHSACVLPVFNSKKKTSFRLDLCRNFGVDLLPKTQILAARLPSPSPQGRASGGGTTREYRLSGTYRPLCPRRAARGPTWRSEPAVNTPTAPLIRAPSEHMAPMAPSTATTASRHMVAVRWLVFWAGYCSDES